jgi:hypothetical protein
MTERAYTEVTKYMEPRVGSYQTATQVKVLSPVKPHIRKADGFHVPEGRTGCTAKVRVHRLPRGLRPWYGNEWMVRELGISVLLPEYVQAADNPERRGSGAGDMEVGLTHSRGVAGVMPRAATRSHLKGSAVVCNGSGGHGPIAELGEPWKRN